jgi:hypothetical protein
VLLLFLYSAFCLVCWVCPFPLPSPASIFLLLSPLGCLVALATAWVSDLLLALLYRFVFPFLFHAARDPLCPPLLSLGSPFLLPHLRLVVLTEESTYPHHGSRTAPSRPDRTSWCSFSFLF